MRSIQLVAAILFVVPWCGSSLGAEPKGPTLQERLKSARDSFRPLKDDAVARRHGELQRALAALDQSLTRSRPGYAQGWKTYLHWDELQQNLANQDTVDLT